MITYMEDRKAFRAHMRKVILECSLVNRSKPVLDKEFYEEWERVVQEIHLNMKGLNKSEVRRYVELELLLPKLPEF